MKITTDGSGNSFIESPLTSVSEAIRISLINPGWTGGECIRINIRDKKNHIRPGAEIPIENIEEVIAAMVRLVRR